MRRMRRGKWSNLTSVKVASLMGVSVSSAKLLLYAVEDQLKSATPREADKIIGRLIYEAWLKKEVSSLGRYFNT